MQTSSNYKFFISSDKLFSWDIPATWSEYEDDEGTYAFFNTTSWTGNLRITPIIFKTNNSVIDVISEEIAGNNITITVQIGDYKCAYFEKNLIQGNDDLLIYYWITGLNNYLFTCSFVIDKDQENSFENENELIVIENIIKSIKIN